MRILFLVFLILAEVLSFGYLAEASSNTTETPSTTYNETVTPAILTAGIATTWTFVGALAFVVIVTIGGILYCTSPSSE